MGNQILLLLLFCACVFKTRAWSQRPPNIIIVLSDDHAYQAIGAYGNPYGATPNIDRLAAQGMRFNRAFVTNSLCGPSRASILTAKYSHLHGFIDNNSRFDGSQQTFVKLLHNAGYQTAWIGKWHLETKPQGFDYWKILPGQGLYFNPWFINMDSVREQHEGYIGDLVTQFSVNWLNQRDTSKPFCLIVGHKAAHRNWQPDTMDLGTFDKVHFPLPDNFYDNYEGRKAAANQDMTVAKTMQMDYDLKMPFDSSSRGFFASLNTRQKEIYQAYYGRIYQSLSNAKLSGKALAEWKYQRYMNDYMSTTRSLDRNIGKLMQYTANQQLDNNTIFIYVSDQGFYLGEHGWFDKRFMYEESFRTPLIVRYPPSIAQGTVNNQLVMNIDLGPTLLQAAGLQPNPLMQGISLWEQFKNTSLPVREAVYYHYYEFQVHSVRPHFGIRDSRYKLLRFYSPDYQAWELFDLQKDSSEMKNLARSKKHQAELKQMQQRCLQQAIALKDTAAVRMMHEAGIR